MKRLQRFICLVLVLCLACPSWAAITQNAVSGGNSIFEESGDSTTLDFDLTIATGSNTNLYVCVGDVKGDQSTVTSVVWNTSESLTKIVEVDAVDIWGASLWRLKAPTTGTHTVTVTIPAASRLAAIAVALDGVDQTTSERTYSTASVSSFNANPITVTAANSQNGDTVIDCVGRRQLEDDTATVDSGQTEIAQERANGFNDVGALMSYEAATGSNTVMSWTMSAASYSYGAIAVPLVPAGGGGGGPVTSGYLLRLRP